MAITPVRANTFEAYPMKDSRAEGYITLYTKSGWDRWRMAVDQISEDLKTKNANYEAAIEAYKLQAKLINDERESLAKKIGDIATKRVQAENAFNVAKEKAQLVVDKFNADKETTSRQKEAVVPSVSTGTGSTWSSGATNSRRVMSDPKARADLDSKLAKMTEITSLAPDNVKDKLAEFTKDVERGRVGGTQDDMNQAYAEAYEKAVTSVGEDKAKDAAPPEMQMGVMAYNTKYGPVTATGATGIPGSSASRGAYQGEYTPDVLAQSQASFDRSMYDAETSKLEADLKAAGIDASALKVPVIEPLDMITAARKTYVDKFGDVPSGVNLRMGGESIGKYKQLMPFEVTNAMKKTEDFFKMYIDDAVSSAKKVATGRELNTDEFNTAVEAGKKRAREVLFGGLAERERFEADRKGTRAPPNAANTPFGEPTQPVVQDTQPTTPLDAERIDVRTIPDDQNLSGGTPTYESLPGLKTFPTVTNITAEQGASGGTATPSAGPRFLTTPKTASDFINKIFALYPEGIPTTITDSPEWKAAVAKTQEQSTMSPPTGTTGTVSAPTTQTPTGNQPNIGVKQEGTIQSTPVQTRPVIVEGPTPRTQTPTVVVPSIGTKQEGVIQSTPAPAQGTLPPARPGYQYNNPVQTPELDIWRELPPATRDPDPQPLKVPVQPGLMPEKHGSRKVYSVDDKDRMAKAKAFMEGAKAVQENPSLAASKIVKTPAGRYVAALYDQNKAKGPNALNLGQLTEHVVREYAGDQAAQKAAVQRLIELNMLDVNAKKLS